MEADDACCLEAGHDPELAQIEDEKDQVLQMLQSMGIDTSGLQNLSPE